MSSVLTRAALALCAAGALSLSAVQAGAATYVAELVFQDGQTGAQPAYGTVTLLEMDPFTVKVTVTLADAASEFVQTGGPHNPFVFNTANSDTVTLLAPVDSFSDGGRGSWNSTPFGAFTNKIACCGGNGAAHGETAPLVFTVNDSAGLTVAGPADHFTTSTAGYLFAADIFDGKTGLTYNIAARDLTSITGGIPEPQTWAMMILGFGAVGALLRRRRGLALT